MPTIPGAGVPGYSPPTMARQNLDNTQGYPGAQGLHPEGMMGGQEFSSSPTEQFYEQGQGGAPPSSIATGGNQWSTFQGQGGAPSSFTSPLQAISNALRPPQ